LDKYYELSGWNEKTGIPERSKLEQLKLADVADVLEYTSPPLNSDAQ
jgi:hypothetical protein